MPCAKRSFPDLNLSEVLENARRNADARCTQCNANEKMHITDAKAGCKFSQYRRQVEPLGKLRSQLSRRKNRNQGDQNRGYRIGMHVGTRCQ